MAASTSNAAHPISCNVFINHCGPDTKKTFASHLYRRLLSHGLTAFIDQDELQVGLNFDRQIKDAIRTASVHVAIFSKGYADSPWCLDELVLMLETGTRIIPVFHHVKPADLRQTHGDGVYARALRNHEMQRLHGSQPRHSSSTIKKWRNALSAVAGISGLDLEVFNSDEGVLIDKVVEAVLKNVSLRKSNGFVAQYRPGLDEKVQDFENEVFVKRHQSAKPQIVGIVGLGGVGKTTLAKEFFDRKRSRDRKSCFLSNVRENAAKGILTSLQSQLFKVLTGADVLIDNTDKGKEALKKHLSSSSVFVVLDDVDDLDQIDALLPHGTYLLSDSLIVITSRDKGVITSSRVENSSIYQLTRLNKQHSRELFCAYAFTQPSAPAGFEDLVHKFLESCIGLPLFLKVFGALLSEKNDKSEWEEVLDRLQRVFPIENSLQIIYDSLNMEQREMFLDCACFFRGLKRDSAIRIWDGSGWEGHLGFQTLQNRCLLEVDIENNIQMQDRLISDFGRALALTKLPLRLWHCTDINKILERFPVPTVRGIRMVPVRGIRMVLGDDVDAFGDIAMSNLQLVDTENAILERILRRPMRFPSLLWLRWNKCPNSSLPSWIPMESLRVLQVSGSVLRTLWEDESQAPLQLRELEISAPLRNIPKSIGRLKHLEWIVVSRFLSGRRVNFTELPKEFCELQSLKTLVLTECSRLQSLPDSFYKLTTLEHIDFSLCRNLERLPEFFGRLMNLQYINLSNCHDLERLPDSFDRLRKLQYIDLRGCHHLKNLPKSFHNLENLQHINLSGCHGLKSLPDLFGDLRNLQEVDLSRCHDLDRLPDSFGNLTYLWRINLSDCHDLEALPDSFDNLKNLQHIDLSRCHNLKRLPKSLRNLSEPKYICLEGCSYLSM